MSKYPTGYVGDKNMDVSRVVFHPLAFNAYLASLSTNQHIIIKDLLAHRDLV